MNTHRAASLITAACLSALLAGCGGTSGGGTQAAGPANAGGSGDGNSAGSGGGKDNPCGSTEPGLCTTITITGAVSVQGSFQVSMTSDEGMLDSCAKWVKGESAKPRLTLPIALGQEVGGHQIGIANRISKSYQGPRTYERKDLGAIDGGLHVDVDHKSYQANDGTTAQAEVAADGSGKLTFANLREATNSSDSSAKGVISGNYTWVCHD